MINALALVALVAAAAWQGPVQDKRPQINLPPEAFQYLQDEYDSAQQVIKYGPRTSVIYTFSWLVLTGMLAFTVWYVDKKYLRQLV